MAPHLTREQREAVVYYRHTLNRELSEIATLLQCSARTVSEILHIYREYGLLFNPNARPRGRPRIIDYDAKAFIFALLQAKPTSYLDELQARLLEALEIDVSVATIYRAICQMAVSHKKVSRAALERDELLRATWQAAYGEIPKEYFVWLDESSVDDHTNQRREGWAPMGRACVQRATFLRGQRFSVLPALTSDGIIALDIFEGSVNKELFIRFLEEQLVRAPVSLNHKSS